jgi:L-rhamnose mutarotase
MSVFYVETYVVKAEKRKEYKLLLARLLKHKKNHPKLFKGVKSYKIYQQEFGTPAGMFIVIWEYENWNDIQTANNRIHKDKEIQKIHKAFHRLIEPATFTGNIWHPIAS